jgi:hypothetical protein
MKRVLLLTLLAVFPAAAQWRHFGSEPMRPTGFFGVGFASPVNPLARGLDTGWNLAGGVGVTSRYVGVLVDGMFSDFGLNHTTLVASGAPRGDQKYWAITVDPVFHVNERGPVDFYVTGGTGIYSQITEYRGFNGFGGGPFSDRGGDLLYSNTIFKPGVDGGAGFAFNVGYLTHVKIFAEARFHHMFTHGSGASFIPVTIGVRF